MLGRTGIGLIIAMACVILKRMAFLMNKLARRKSRDALMVVIILAVNQHLADVPLIVLNEIGQLTTRFS